MKGWWFLLIAAGLLLMAPAHAYKGGILEDSPSSAIWLVVGLALLALLVRPAEENLIAQSSGPGCVGRMMQVVMWVSVIAFALWLLAGSPDGRGL